MSWFQTTITLRPRGRGFHLITGEIGRAIPTMRDYRVGLAHLFIQHTSAALAINESYDPAVRVDMAAWFDRNIAENEPYFTHTLEGSDDMPAHIKGVLTGCELTVPIQDGRFNIGTWQGIWLCEFRNHGGARNVVVTLQGARENEE